MRLVHVYPYYGADLTGGAEVYEYELTRGLAALGAEVDVLTTCTRRPQHTSAFTSAWPTDYPPGTIQDGAITIRRFPVSFAVPAAAGVLLSRAVFRRWAREGDAAGTGGDAITAWGRAAATRPPVYDWLVTLGRGPHSQALLSALSTHRADVLISGFVPFATLWHVARAARRRRTPTVVLPFFHPDDRYHHFRVFYRCFAAARAVLAQSPYSAELFRALAPGSNPVQIGVGVDRALLSDPHISGARFRARYGFGDAKLVLFVGRKEPAKRYDLAVEAVERLGDPNVVLVLIGEDVDGRPLTSPRARHLGRVERGELLDAYDACDVFVLPSEHESFGIVFLEAWMRGKPVLGNRACRPVASVIEDGVDGYLCADAAELAARIRQLLAEPDTAAAMGRAGQMKAAGRYTWDAIARRVYDLCRELVNG